MRVLELHQVPDIDALEARPYIFGVGIVVRYVVRHKVNSFEAFAIARSGHADSTGVRWVLCVRDLRRCQRMCVIAGDCLLVDLSTRKFA